MIPFVMMMVIGSAHLLQTVRGQPQFCPNNGHLFRDECFWIPDDLARWVDAEQECNKNEDARLVAITDQEINDFLTDLIDRDVWIGLHDTHNESDWKWSNDSPVNYTNFIEEEQTELSGAESSENNCVALQSSNGKWKDSRCRDRKGMICAKPRSPTHCSNGGTLFRDQCYWYGGVNAWSLANEECARFGDGVKLAVVQDPELNAFLGRLIYPGIWIGLHDRGIEGKWEWVNGSPLQETSYQNWMAGKPRNVTQSGDCAVLSSFRSSGQWKDQSCDQWTRYVCALQPCYEGGNIGSGDGGDGASVGKDESDNCWEFESDRRCTSCVTGSQCSKEDGTCLCESQFADMACDKDDMTVTIYGPDQYNVGSSVTLRCHVNLPSTDVTVVWQKDIDTKILLNHENTEVKVFSEKGDYELTIKNLQIEDAGSYVCVASTLLGEVSVLKMATFLLDVAAPSVPVLAGSADDKGKKDAVNQGVVVGTLIGIGVFCIGCVLAVIVIKAKAKRENTISTWPLEFTIQRKTSSENSF
ncbi:uncharacterized protein [Asterias amurensis]|uniref:uncharacterized protein isoform X2 n=1 Tax=Asterias amurensis TaxID=7602 RepID=UPI003AB67809